MPMTRISEEADERESGGASSVSATNAASTQASNAILNIPDYRIGHPGDTDHYQYIVHADNIAPLHKWPPLLGLMSL